MPPGLDHYDDDGDDDDEEAAVLLPITTSVSEGGTTTRRSSSALTREELRVKQVSNWGNYCMPRVGLTLVAADYRLLFNFMLMI